MNEPCLHESRSGSQSPTQESDAVDRCYQRVMSCRRGEARPRRALKRWVPRFSHLDRRQQHVNPTHDSVSVRWSVMLSKTRVHWISMPNERGGNVAQEKRNAFALVLQATTVAYNQQRNAPSAHEHRLLKRAKQLHTPRSSSHCRRHSDSCEIVDLPVDEKSSVLGDRREVAVRILHRQRTDWF